MARKYKKSTRKAYATKKAPTRRRASSARQPQTIKIVLQHQMAGPQTALPIMGPDGPAFPAPKPRGSKL